MMRHMEMACNGDHHSHRELRDRNGFAPRGKKHWNASNCCCIEVDTCAGLVPATSCELKLRHGCKKITVERLKLHDNDSSISRGGPQFVGIQLSPGSPKTRTVH